MDYYALAIEMVRAIAFKHPPMEEPGQLTRGEMGILMYLYHERDGMLSGELSKALTLSTGRVATALKGLERKGYIVRRPDPTDKRRVAVFIQEKGTAFILAKQEKMLQRLEQRLRRLGEEDAKEFVRIVKRISEEESFEH